MQIQPLEPRHLEACAVLFRTVFCRPPWNEAWTLETAATRLSDLLNTPGFSGVLARLGSRVVGFAAGAAEQWDQERHFYLQELCVAPDQQRQGLGTALLAALCTDLAARGLTRVYLLTTRASSAEAFYHKNGFYTSEKMVMLGRKLKP